MPWAGWSAVPPATPVRHSLSKAEEVPEGRGFQAVLVHYLCQLPSLWSVPRGAVGANLENPPVRLPSQEGQNALRRSKYTGNFSYFNMVALPRALHTEKGKCGGESCLHAHCKGSCCRSFLGACCTLQPCLQGFGLCIRVWNLSDDGGVPKGGATRLEMTCFPRY